MGIWAVQRLQGLPQYDASLIWHTHTHTCEGKAGQWTNKPHFNQNDVFTFLRASVRETKQTYFTFYTKFPHDRQTTQMLPKAAKTWGQCCWKLCGYQSGRNKEDKAPLCHRQEEFAPVMSNTVMQISPGEELSFSIQCPTVKQCCQTPAWFVPWSMTRLETNFKQFCICLFF